MEFVTDQPPPKKKILDTALAGHFVYAHKYEIGYCQRKFLSV